MVNRLLLLCTVFAWSSLSLAQEYQLGELLITQPWSRELPVELPGGSAYFTVHNHGSETDRLIAVSSPRAQTSRLHTQSGNDGMMNMQHVAGMDIPAHTEVTFQPGANHVMLSGMEQPLKAGEQFPLTLEFEKAGTIEVLVEVRPVEAQASHGTVHVH
ncbi:copper chaperone PCu(A)C [Pseudomonas putida]|uniref:copper chaperone PCu(A)C n=1 Tax=Pseudomonas putida TaxID=303 RepID=UPI0023666468|nr:copper chaperone PCu(A)C [Pseudomonas putida]MDD2048317.1 copper chaperone PCu(A)C [Pseudomonas putida]